MKYRISHPTKKLNGSIELTASKSESNRALIIQALCREKFVIDNLATAKDTMVLQQVLQSAQTAAFETVYDVGASGTAMRFLTAYFATQPGTHILTGSDRMKNRPIGVLVQALWDLGADIEYLEEDGFPPLKITGRVLKDAEIEMDGNVSSQFVSALLMISPELPNGLVIRFKGEITSRPYVNMTLKMMEEFRVYGQWHDDCISVSNQQYHKKSEPLYLFQVEADWSSASYWYAIAALAEEADFTIKGLKNPSLQGDSIVSSLFSFFGVKTEVLPEGIHLTKIKSEKVHFGFDFSDCPDLAQTLAVVTSALNIPSLFNGVHTLRIKETDRIIALQKELKKLNIEVNVLNDNSIEIKPQPITNNVDSSISIETYDDHRMAMAFATLAMKLDSITIENPEVVEKSYPAFWDDLKSVGFQIDEL
ncbi:MAG: 3-phosphoshikimate 1-carboxyvinyltransferase [Bacteroidota bacterium]